jgi:hypothetical protein
MFLFTLSIYIWCGAESSQSERRKAGEVATQMKSKCHGKPTIHTIDEKEHNDEFWRLLGGKGVIASALQGGK